MNKFLNDKINEYVIKFNLNSLDIVEEPREFIVMILSDILNTSTTNIKLGNVTVTEKTLLHLENILKDISEKKIPPEYLTNASYIYGLKFFVDRNVLIPRQDTETLIEAAVSLIKKNKCNTMLDLCTGSGIIGITCAVKTDINSVTLADISEKALNVAKINVINLDKKKKCKLINSNMFDRLYKLKSSYDIIVSNPPYLKSSEMKDISDFVKKEPSIALDGGKDGLDFYRIIYSNAKYFLNNNGIIAVEIGYMQADDVINNIKEHVVYKDIKVIKDINGKDRVVLCHFQKK